VNASLRRTLQQESRRGDAPSPSPPTGSSYGPHAGGEAHQPKITGEIIPWFDPENQSCVVTSWVCYMQLRLKGAARDWFNRLTDYDKTWEEWKALLQHAFPRCVDYVTTLRKKLPNESMTTYYHAKLSLIRQCRLDNEAVCLSVSSKASRLIYSPTLVRFSVIRRVNFTRGFLLLSTITKSRTRRNACGTRKTI
jgi:hypothetical protein